MAHERFTTHVGERGRFVVPADVRRRLHLEPGDLLVVDVDDEAATLVVRKASDVAHGLRGRLLKNVAPGRDLAAELLADRRAEVEREAGRGQSALTHR
jgi:AbrB family looped-hinge helix DNA binding protein